MPNSLSRPPVFAIKTKGNPLTLASAQGHLAHIFVLENDIIRVLLLPKGELRFPRTWAIAPGAEDVPTEGRDRFDLTGFTLPSYACNSSDGKLAISTQNIRLTIELTGFFCHWETRSEDQHNGAWQAVANDRPTQAYNFAWWDEKVYHYLKRDADEMYFGLGERAGDTNRAGQSYRLCNVDPMGYSARTSDPLYKHIPFYMTWNKKSETAFGLFYDSLSDCTFNLGKELDNYHGFYRYFVADHGDLDYYMIAGPKPADISRKFTWLTGRPAFTPKWGLGYSGSTMTYTDAPNAQERMNEFLDGCAKHDMLCSSFHLSSGYTSINDKRYVFNWNREKFPDPGAFAQHYLNHGIKLCANIKPCLLHDHPLYSEAAAAGLFINEADGTPAQVQFWDETGAYLDFTNPQTYAWWKARVTDALLDYGIASTWNDNNEFEIWSKTPQIKGFGTARAAAEAKPLQTLLMIKASREAQQTHAPEKRPFLISRSGAAGMQRYVQTWSGDNNTSWETLRYNIRMANGLALSGVSNIGHDIGGFAGPAPDAELLLRWVQHGIFLPRFSIHSWNDDKSVNEPWMHPEITPHIRQLIKFRARLTPYFYDLLWRSHTHYEPMIRPTFHDFPHDPNCFAENDDMLLGQQLLVASVVEPGKREREVYLPQGATWYDFWSGSAYAGGQSIVLAAGLTNPPLLVRENAIIPLNIAEQHFAQEADQRGFALFPAQQATLTQSFFEDDGESCAYRNGQYGLWQVDLVATPEQLSLTIQATGACPPAQKNITLFLREQETRAVTLSSGKLLRDEFKNGWREIELDLSPIASQ